MSNLRLEELEDYEPIEEEIEEEEKPKRVCPSWKKLREKYNIPDYDELTKGWWSVRNVLDYNRLFNMIVGPRSLGKSTNTALYLIIYFLKHLDDKRKCWQYIRRDEDEVMESADTWFDNACDLLNRYITDEEDKLVVEHSGGVYTLNDLEAGMSVPLNKQHKFKSKNLSIVKFQVYDEAILKGGRGYIGGMAHMEKEYDFLQSLATSADRDLGSACADEVITFVLANNEGFNNPMFRGTGADKYIRANSKFVAPKGKEWVLQMAKYDDSPEAAKILQSRRMKLQREDMLAHDYDYADTSRLNVFVKELNVQGTTLANMVWNGIEFHLIVDYRQGIYYVKKGHDKSKSYIRNYALTLPDHGPNYMLILSPSKTEAPLTMMKEARLQGLLYFESYKLLEAVDTYLRFMI